MAVTVSAHEALNQLDPHIFLVAGNAFRAMVREGTSQSLVINGESGAGKTETTKKAMQFFAQLAGGTGVEDQVLEVGAWHGAKRHTPAAIGLEVPHRGGCAMMCCVAPLTRVLLQKYFLQPCNLLWIHCVSLRLSTCPMLLSPPD